MNSPTGDRESALGDDLGLQPLRVVAAKLRRREVSSVTLTEWLLSRVARLDPILHSYLTVTADAARTAAVAADAEIAAGCDRGPLHGIPIAIKDLCTTAGIRTTCASPVLADWIPSSDATVVARLRAAGAIVIGKLNLTEFALSGYHPDLPIPTNPWDHDLHAGGSSSGSAVAVAAGLCFGAIGTDTGGSIRIPSAWNGVVGLKPTYGRVSRHGVFPLSRSLDHVGPMTRRVGDAAAMLDAISGFDSADPTSLRLPPTSALAQLGNPIAGIRIGYDAAYVEPGTMPDLVVALQEMALTLERLGAKMVAVTVPSIDRAVEAWFPICAADALHAHGDLFPRKAASYGTLFRTFLEYGARLTGVDYARAHEARIAFAACLPAIFADCDLMLCPGAFSTAPPAAAIDPYGPFSVDIAPFLRFSAPFNFSGNPTLSLPCGFSAQGMPFGAQLVGQHCDEALLLRVGHAFEEATGYWQRHPSLP